MTTDIAAYLPLCDRLNLHHELPYTPDWSAAPDFLELIVEHCLADKPETVMECSSGLTTLMLARCCQINNRGHVYSLENGLDYAEATRRHINRHGLDDYSTVLHVPLEDYAINQHDYSWYAAAPIPKKSIDILVIDGPPGFLQRHSRYPALPVFFERLAENAIVFLDDAARIDERELVDLWLGEYPALTHEFIGTERGCSVLRVSRHSGD